MAVDLEKLLSKSSLRTRKPSEAQKKELAARRSAAQALARVALVRLHHGDYEDLYRQALVKVDAERGPLPE